MVNLVKLLAVLTVFVVMSDRSSADDFDTRKHINWHQWRGPDANGVAKRADPERVKKVAQAKTLV